MVERDCVLNLYQENHRFSKEDGMSAFVSQQNGKFKPEYALLEQGYRNQIDYAKKIVKPILVRKVEIDHPWRSWWRRTAFKVKCERIMAESVYQRRWIMECWPEVQASLFICPHEMIRVYVVAEQTLADGLAKELKHLYVCDSSGCYNVYSIFYALLRWCNEFPDYPEFYTCSPAEAFNKVRGEKTAEEIVALMQEKDPDFWEQHKRHLNNIEWLYRINP